MSSKSGLRRNLRLIVNRKLCGVAESQNPAALFESLSAAANESLSLSLTDSTESVSFVPMQDIRAIAATRHKSMQVSSRIAFLATIFILSCLLSALPVFTMLFLFLLAAVLCRNKMLTRYRIDFSKSEIKFEHDQFRSLSINWNHVAQVELAGNRDQCIRIKLSKSFLGRFQSWYFQDLVGPDKSIQILLSSMNDDTRRNCLSGFLANCPPEILHDCRFAENSVKQESESRIAASSISENSIFEHNKRDSLSLPYLAPQAYRKVLSSFLQSNEKLIVFMLSIFSICMIFMLGMFKCLPFLGLLLGVLAVLAFSVKDMEQWLNFDSEGFYFKYKFPAGSRSMLIAWHEIASVYSLKRRRLLGNFETAEFLLCPDKSKRFKLALLCFLSGGILKKQGCEFLLSVDLSLFKSTDDRRLLLSLVKENLIQALIDESIEEALNPTDPASYTQLWLDCLRDNQERSFEGRLESGWILGNGSYKIIDFLGAGGQACTYLAKSTKADRSEQLPAKLVLKEFILPAHAGAEPSLATLAQIQSELKLMQKIEHPNLPRYYDLFVEDHRCYLVLEYIDGKSLRQMLSENGPLAEETILKLARQMALILQHLHCQNPPLVHRDFTPENLILDSNNNLKLIDFNLTLEHDGMQASSCVVGKHAYLPPEQFRGSACPQSDIYALGASLYFLATAEDPEPISSSHPILRNELISAELDLLIARATELELAKRYTSAEEFLAALDEIVSG